jgi:hypothetical protein
MTPFARGLRRVCAAVVPIAIAASISACLVDPDPGPRRCTVNCGTPAPTATAPQPTTPSPPPRLSIDTGRTLTAQPGEGAGIFITYAGSGRWLVAWTCDTYASARSCAFDVSVAAARVSSLTPTPTNAIIASDGQSFRARTTTSATLDSVSFDTDPGGSIVVSSTLNGVPTPDLVFFVSNGKLATAPSDPIELVPTPE